MARNTSTDNHALPFAGKLLLAAAIAPLTGWLMARNADGFGVPFTETTGLISAGIAQHDQAAGATDGARAVIVDTMVVDLEQSTAAGDSFADANVPAVAYGIDNRTIGKKSTGRSIAGVYFGQNEDTGKARVFVGPAAYAMALGLLAGDGGSPAAAQLRARAATTSNLAATLSEITLTMDADGALGTIDGVTLAVGDSLFAKDQTDGAAKGLYVVTSLGDGSSPATFVRAPSFDETAEAAAGLSIFVSEGTANGNQIWDLTTDDPITLGTTALTFTKRPSLADLLSTASGKGASLIGLQDAAGNTTASDLESAIAELYGFNKLKIQTFDATLVAGTVTKSTGIAVTASTRAVGIVPTVRGGTFPAGGFQSLTAGNVVGAAGVGAVTITARKADGTLENACTDTVSVLLIG